jgi:hypothetical protein
MGRDAAPSSGSVPYAAAAQHPPRTYRHVTGCRQVSDLPRAQASSQLVLATLRQPIHLELSIKDEDLILIAGIVSPAYRGRDAGRAVWRRMLGVQEQLLAGT